MIPTPSNTVTCGECGKVLPKNINAVRKHIRNHWGATSLTLDGVLAIDNETATSRAQALLDSVKGGA